ncbi:MAG: hypothetical protein KGL90_11490 [Burkholderiales bacterium]|nr:hypothetical protein [Burkholderiales bacterium]
MLISYPVLPTRQNNESEDAYLDRLLAAHVDANEGRYPVSTLNTSHGPVHRWHGGIHVIGGGEPIRAIADGVVVAYRFARSPETYEGLGQYDTSFVLIRHATQTGEHTEVGFYTLYMHLASRSSLLPDRFQQLSEWLRQASPGPSVQRPTNLRVWRKDVLGFAGVLYDREACHVEVFATDAGLRAFWRDSTSVTQGAGSADFYGDAHFVIPANRDFAVRHPRAAENGAHRIDFPGNIDFALPEGAAGQNALPLCVSVKLEQGRRVATTYVAGADGSYSQLGAPVVQDNYEYELFRLATALYPDCPSAGLEWLRFGRVLGTDVTTRNENWQLVRYSATAMGYVDLAPDAIAKLSDADFVHWQGWEKREEGQTANAGDGICDDQRTITLCQGADEASRVKVRHLVCKAPSEWDAADLEARYGHLREPGQPLAEADSWQKFVEHVQKMAFWADAGLGDRSIWHFHPMQFVRHFRKSAWLSLSELSQLMPRYPYYDRVGNQYRAHTNGPATVYQITNNAARIRIERYVLPLNEAMRKYHIQSRHRQAHFLAQVFLETDRWKTMREYGSGAPNPGIPMAQYYGPFYGRGILQLTWLSNYVIYGDFRSAGALPNHSGNYSDQRITGQTIHWSGDPGSNGSLQARWSPRFDPDVIASSAHNACDSGGFFWASKFVGGGRYNINSVTDAGIDAAAVGRVCVLVNGGGNGYMERQGYAAYLFRLLTDDVSLDVEKSMQTPRGTIIVNYERPSQ